MRKAVVNNVEFDCPRYVVRVPGGWQVRFPGARTVFFGDARHGSVSASHQAAITRRTETLPISEMTETRYALKEREGKRDPVGIPGVFLVYHPRRGKRAPQVELLVSVKGQPARTIYVGTSKTWEARLAQKLEIAREVRLQKISEANKPSA